MNRRFSRSFETPLTASEGMLGIGAGEYASTPSVILPPAVFIIGTLIGVGMVWFSQQGVIDNYKDKISKMNKQYQKKGT